MIYEYGDFDLNFIGAEVRHIQKIDRKIETGR